MDVAEYYDKLAKDYHRHYDGTSEEYPANQFRLKIILERLKAIKANHVWELGVGEGTPLVEIAKLGIEVGGCDISKEMVLKAMETLKRAGISPNRVVLGDENYHGFENDAVIATGVLPHTKNEDALIKQINEALRPGGTAFVEFRNSLFSLFTFNRHTLGFIVDELLAGVSSEVKTDVADGLVTRLSTANPPRTEFDAISRFHNPFELQKTFERHGFNNIQFHWYHYHAAPPIFGDYWEESMKLEGTNDWRGMFLCSAGVIEAVKC